MQRSRRSGRRQQVKRIIRAQCIETLESFDSDEFLETFDFIQHIQAFNEINDTNQIIDNSVQNSAAHLEKYKGKRRSSEISECKEIEIIYDNKPRIKSIETLIPPIKFRILRIIDTIVID